MRVDAGLTLGAAARAAGISEDRLAAVEDGREADPFFAETVALATAYGIPLAVLESGVQGPARVGSADTPVAPLAGAPLEPPPVGRHRPAVPVASEGSAPARRLTPPGSRHEVDWPDEELEVRLANRGTARLLALMLFEHAQRHPRRRPSRRTT